MTGRPLERQTRVASGVVRSIANAGPFAVMGVSASTTSYVECPCPYWCCRVHDDGVDAGCVSAMGSMKIRERAARVARAPSDQIRVTGRDDGDMPTATRGFRSSPLT